MPFGWTGCWPFQWGGGPTPIEQALDSLRAGVGKGHAAEQDGVEWRWREARAIGIAIGMSMDERALSQFEPSTATSGLPFWRELYSLEGYSDQDVRDIAAARKAATDDYGEPDVLALLVDVDSRFSLLSRTWEQSTTTVHGRTFGDWDGGSPFNQPGGKNETLYPNYSSFMEYTVKLDVTGVPTDADLASVALAGAMLDQELPAWVDYEIGGGAGFTLDESLLDWDRFDS